MTTHREKRCVHCSLIYYYQSSGRNSFHPVNNDRYCPDCMIVINKALESVPIRFQTIWVETSDYSVDFLLDYRKRSLEETRKKYPNRIIGERVLAPLFDLEDPTNLHKSYVVSYQGEEYAVETWTKTPERNCVKILMEKNMITGKIRPYRDV